MLDPVVVFKNLRDIRDHIVMVIVTVVLVFATVFLVRHPTDANFMTWAGLVATIVGVYHFLCIFDDKRPDAALGES